jgi:signal transduction histidine kinase
VHHIIVSIERISAPRVVPHTIEVPALNEDTFAKRLAGETGTRPALNLTAAAARFEPGSAEAATVPAPDPAPTPMPMPMPMPTPASPDIDVPLTAAASTLPSPPNASTPMTTGEFELGSMDVTNDSLPEVARAPEGAASLSALAQAAAEPVATLAPASDAGPMATTITSPEVAREASRPDPSTIIDPPDARLNEVLQELYPLDAARLDLFLTEGREKAGQLRAIMKLPAREPQAFREKLVLILELIRGIHARAKRMPLQSVCDRAERFEEALGKLRDKQTLSGNDFLPLAVKLDDLLSHLAIQGEVLTRLREWRTQNGLSDSVSIDTTQRSATMTGTTIRQPKLKRPGDDSHPGSETQKAKRLSDLSQDSLEEMAQFLADMYSKRVSLVCVGLEDVPGHYRRAVEKILGQLIHNAIRHGLEAPADRVVQDKPEIGTVAVQFLRVGAEGYQLSVQDDGRGLDHDKIRAEAVRQGVMSADAAAKIDPRKLASLIFRPGFTTAGEGVRGIGMDVVRDLVNKAGGKVGIATKPGEYTRIRVALPHEKNASGAAVA